ncbi:MAG: exonuclease SbcCD subunit D [Blautia marasmi]
MRPGMLRPFAEEIPETYEEAVKTALPGAKLHKEERNVLLAHQFVTAGGERPETSDSEQLSLGGIDRVDASVFEAFDYVALGHIHRPQKIGNVKIRYAGSPLKYSFSEWKQTKSVTVAELGEKGTLSVRKLSLEPKTEMAVLKDTMEALVSDKYERYREGYYLSVVVTDEEILEHPMERLRKIFPGMLEFAVENRRSRSGGISGSAELQCLKKRLWICSGSFMRNKMGFPCQTRNRNCFKIS